MTWSLILRVADAFARWHERRTAVRRLSALDDRMLGDIGIDRHEIGAVVRRSAGFRPVSHSGCGRVVILPNGSLMDLSGGMWPRSCGAPRF